MIKHMKTSMQWALTFSLLLLSIPGLGQNRKVNLMENLPFDQVLEMAKEQNKYIFLDFGSLTCKPCLYIKKNVLTLDSVADFINSRFVSVDYNVGTEKDRLRKKYNVVGEPVLLILDQNGQFMHRMAGKVEGDELMARFRQGLDPQQNIVALDKKYQNGARDKDFILFYLQTLKHAGEVQRMNQVYHEYTSGSLENLKQKDRFEVFYEYNQDVGSREVLYLVDHREEFYELFGKARVDNKIYSLFSMSSIKYLYGHVNPMQDTTFVTILHFLQRSDHPLASEWLCYLVPAQYKYDNWAKMGEEIDNIYHYNILKGKKGRSFKDMMVNQFMMYCQDPAGLVYAMRWCDELSEDADEKDQARFARAKKAFEERIKKGKPEEETLDWKDL